MPQYTLHHQLLRVPSMVSLFCEAQDFLGILKGRKILLVLIKKNSGALEFSYYCLI